MRAKRTSQLAVIDAQAVRDRGVQIVHGDWVHDDVIAVTLSFAEWVMIDQGAVIQ